METSHLSKCSWELIWKSLSCKWRFENLSSVRFATTRDFQMTLLIFAEWKGENREGVGDLSETLKEGNGVLWGPVLHTLPNLDKPQIPKLMIQGGNDDLTHCWTSSPQVEVANMQTSLRDDQTHLIIKNHSCSLTFFLLKILQCPLKIYHGFWEKNGTEIHFSTEERMTACRTALPNLHVMKRSPRDRRSRQAASAAVFCH